MASSFGESQTGLAEPIKYGQSAKRPRGGGGSRFRMPEIQFFNNMNRKKWVGLGVGVLAAWAAFTMDRSPLEVDLWLTEAEPSSPQDVAAASSRQVTRLFEKWDGTTKASSPSDTAAETPPATVIITAPATPEAVTPVVAPVTPSNQTVPPFPTVTPSGPPPMTAPAPTEVPATTPFAPLPAPANAVTTAPPALVPIVEVLPNPMEYSVDAGSVICFGEVKTILISQAENAPFALTQLENGTGENWTGSANQGPNPLDEQLYREVLISSGYTDGQEPAGDFPVYVRTGCVGLEN